MISRRERALSYAVLAFFSLLALAPVLGILSTAFSDPRALTTGFALPDGFHWDNFAEAWTQGRFGRYLGSSLLVAAVVVSVSAVLSTLAGYAFGTMRFRGSGPLFALFLVGLTLPAEAVIVPLYHDMRWLGLTDTYWALIGPQTAQSLAFGTFWMRAHFRTTPRSLAEAARLDGANSWTVLWRVLLPGARPAVTTMLVLTFMWTWNEFLIALVMVSDEAHRTVPLGLAFFQGQHAQDNALLAAGAVLVALPVVIVYVALQRRFIDGMLSGAVKE